MSFVVPASWEELTQQQLRKVLRLFWIYDGVADLQMRVQVAAFLYFTGLEVAKRTEHGWLCGEKASGKMFLLDPELLPSLMQPLSWINRPEEMSCRIEQVGKYKAVDFSLQGFLFGDYLMTENYFQSFLLSGDSECLVGMARLLYCVGEDEDAPELKEEVLMGCFLWFNAVKQELARQFPHFLKSTDGERGAVTRELLVEGMRAQIRLLTKGDVTKQKYILEQIDTWTALAELDALAKEAGEMERKYGK